MRLALNEPHERGSSSITCKHYLGACTTSAYKVLILYAKTTNGKSWGPKWLWCSLWLTYILRLQTQTPVVIQGMMETWRSRKWSVQSLKERIGHVEVPVELSRWNKGEGRWGDYRDLHKATNIQADGEFGPCFSPHTPSEFHPIGHICKRKKFCHWFLWIAFVLSWKFLG